MILIYLRVIENNSDKLLKPFHQNIGLSFMVKGIFYVDLTLTHSTLAQIINNHHFVLLNSPPLILYYTAVTSN